VPDLGKKPGGEDAWCAGEWESREMIHGFGGDMTISHLVEA